MTRLGTQRTIPYCRKCPPGRERGVRHTCGRRDRRHPPEVPVPGCRACEGARCAHTCTFQERTRAVAAHVEAQGAAAVAAREVAPAEPAPAVGVPVPPPPAAEAQPAGDHRQLRPEVVPPGAPLLSLTVNGLPHVPRECMSHVVRETVATLRSMMCMQCGEYIIPDDLRIVHGKCGRQWHTTCFYTHMRQLDNMCPVCQVRI